MLCPQCEVPADIRLKLKGNILLLACKHKCQEGELLPDKLPSPLPPSDLSGKQFAWPFQEDYIKFALDSNLNCLNADAMGLGKTVQALLVIREGAIRGLDVFPCLIVVKSATIYQWCRQINTWVNNSGLGVMPLLGRGHQKIFGGFQFYAVSMDSLAALQQAAIDFGFKSIIVDECHSYNNTDSKRTKALYNVIAGKTVERKGDFVKQYYREGGKTETEIKITTSPIKHKLFLSGTPFKNRADEYFVSLNLLAPHIFSDRHRFRRLWLTTNTKGQWTSIHPRMLERFQAVTSKFIIRREKHDVLKDLPKLNRDYQIVSIEDSEIRNSYNSQLKAFRFKFETETLNSISILGELARLRRITAMAKLPNALEFISTWKEQAELEQMVDPKYPKKLVVGIHHHAVKDNLKIILEQEGKQILTLSGEDSADRKQDRIDKFISDEKKPILIMNMLAGGVGVDGLQHVCCNTLIVEREWSPADEEQFESRLERAGQKYPVQATYLIAKGTIDEFFHELVEEKRRIFGETFQGWSMATDASSIRELAERTLGGGLL